MSSIGEVGDNIKGAANALPFEQMRTAQDQIGEALNNAWDVLEGSTEKDAQDALENLGKALQLVEEVQGMLPKMHQKMYGIAARLGTLVGGSESSPAAASAPEHSQSDHLGRSGQKLPALAPGFTRPTFTGNQPWENQVMSEAWRMFPDHDYEMVEDLIQNAPDIIQLEKDGKPVGFLAGALLPFGRYNESGVTYFVRFLMVFPEARGHGYGAEMMAETERRAREAGATAVELEATAQSKEFYEHLGYVENREDENIAVNSMRKAL